MDGRSRQFRKLLEIVIGIVNLLIFEHNYFSYQNSQYLFLLQDEFHQRLRFVRRGLVAMANAGPNDNQSQFFFTLGATVELNGKHTIFGKVLRTAFCHQIHVANGLNSGVSLDCLV